MICIDLVRCSVPTSFARECDLKAVPCSLLCSSVNECLVYVLRRRVDPLRTIYQQKLVCHSQEIGGSRVHYAIHPTKRWDCPKSAQPSAACKRDPPHKRSNPRSSQGAVTAAACLRLLLPKPHPSQGLSSLSLIPPQDRCSCKPKPAKVQKRQEPNNSCRDRPRAKVCHGTWAQAHAQGQSRAPTN